MLKKGSTLKKKLHMLMLVCLVPLMVMTVYLLSLISWCHTGGMSTGQKMHMQKHSLQNSFASR